MLELSIDQVPAAGYATDTITFKGRRNCSSKKTFAMMTQKRSTSITVWITTLVVSGPNHFLETHELKTKGITRYRQTLSKNALYRPACFRESSSYSPLHPGSTKSTHRRSKQKRIFCRHLKWRRQNMLISA